eukprot:gene4851-biopygen5893
MRTKVPSIQNVVSKVPIHNERALGWDSFFEAAEGAVAPPPTAAAAAAAADDGGGGGDGVGGVGCSISTGFVLG